MTKEEEKRLVAQTMALVEALKKIADWKMDNISPGFGPPREKELIGDILFRREDEIGEARRIAHTAIDTWKNL